MWQEILVGIIVLLAIVFAVYRFATRKTCSCGNGNSCCQSKQIAEKDEQRRCQGCNGNGKGCCGK